MRCVILREEREMDGRTKKLFFARAGEEAGRNPLGGGQKKIPNC